MTAATFEPVQSMHGLVNELYPICRSITGDGVRRTLDIVGRHVPLERYEVPSGTPVLDWTVPKEWRIRDAWIKNLRGEKIVDFARSNLHVVSYSAPVHRRMPLSELRGHLFSVPDRPDWIPYRTTYYRETWGFCVAHRVLETMRDAEYEVCVDADLIEGHLSYAECVVPGDTQDEVLISCHVCHPSLCNDNLSGIVVATSLAQHLRALPQRRYTYRILFIPGTIGSITWLAANRAQVDRIKHGLVITCVGDPAGFNYKKSRRGNAAIDRVIEHVLQHSGVPFNIEEFSPYGYDERQFCSPGFNLPVGCIMRSQHATFPEYHTSADDLSFVTEDAMRGTLARLVEMTEVLERDGRYVNLSPFGEPQLGRRGLYSAIGGDADAAKRQMTMLWVLNLCDGEHTLLDVATRAGLPFREVARVAKILVEHELLRRVD